MDARIMLVAEGYAWSMAEAAFPTLTLESVIRRQFKWIYPPTNMCRYREKITGSPVISIAQSRLRLHGTQNMYALMISDMTHH